MKRAFSPVPRKAFTLMELLTVVAVMSLLGCLAIPALNGLGRSQAFTRAAYQVGDALERARTYAMANNTYAWVGFCEVDAANPSAPGAGEVVLCTVASKDGTRYDTSRIDASMPPPIDPLVVQVGKVVRLPGLHLAALDASFGALTPALPPVARDYSVGDDAFGCRTGTSAPNPTTFSYPVGSAAPQYTFRKIIEFSPRGEAVKIADLPSPWIGLGLEPIRGNRVEAAVPDRIALQVAGTTSEIKVYRP